MSKKYLLNLFLVVLLFSFCFVNLVQAGEPTPKTLKDAFNTSVDSPLGKAGNAGGYEIRNVNDQAPLVIAQIIRFALSFIGVVFLILMVLGGYLWMTDRGNEEQVRRAKNLITAAVIGLFIVLSAYAITYFVVEKIGNATLQ